jgi:hypothetical protein
MERTTHGEREQRWALVRGQPVLVEGLPGGWGGAARHACLSGTHSRRIRTGHPLMAPETYHDPR